MEDLGQELNEIQLKLQRDNGIKNINKHTLAHIRPSKHGEDGIGVFASTQIEADVLLFQLPEGFDPGGTVELSGEEIKKYIYNPAALEFLKMRIVPHIADSSMYVVGKSNSNRAPTDDELIYSLPASGPNGVGLSSYIGHANEGRPYNVTLSDVIDSSGYLAMKTTHIVEKGEELLVQHDKDQDHILKYHQNFITCAMNALQRSNSVIRKGAIKKNVDEIEDEQKKDLIENFNEVCLKLAPSNIYGVGTVAAPGAAIKIQLCFAKRLLWL